MILAGGRSVKWSGTLIALAKSMPLSRLYAGIELAPPAISVPVYVGINLARRKPTPPMGPEGFKLWTGGFSIRERAVRFIAVRVPVSGRTLIVGQM